MSGLDKPTGLAFDFAGNLFVADFATNALYKVTPSKTKSTFAQNLNGPQGLTFDRFRILYVANSKAGTVEAFTSVGSRFTHIFNITSRSVSPLTPARGLPVMSMFLTISMSRRAAMAARPTAALRNSPTIRRLGETFASDVGCPLQIAFEPARDPLFNISTRARVEALPNRELIGGFSDITGNDAKTVLIRGIGPSLAKQFGITQRLLDPTLELHTPDGVVFNDNWMDSQKEEIQATGAAPRTITKRLLSLH